MTDDLTALDELTAARLRHPTARPTSRPHVADDPPVPITPPDRSDPLTAAHSLAPVPDWIAARTAWEAGEASARAIAALLDVAPSTVTRRITRERWERPTVVDLRPQAVDATPRPDDLRNVSAPDTAPAVAGDELRARWEAARARLAAFDARPIPVDVDLDPLAGAW